MFPMILTNDYLNIIIDGKSYTINSSNEFFPVIVEGIKNKDWKSVQTLIDLANAINSKGKGKITVEDGVIFYNGYPCHNVVADRILEQLSAGFDVDPMIKFLENLMQNPSKSAIDELYLFMEANKLPITPDGHFLAYKVVTNDFKDKHTRTFDNSVGATVKMDRSKCDMNRDRTCSSGLHFCGFSYLSSFGSPDDQIVIVKVNPKDVTSIPSDYNNAKGRACEYLIDSHYGLFSDHFQVDYLSTSPIMGDLDVDDEFDTWETDNGQDDCDSFTLNLYGENPIKVVRNYFDLSSRAVSDRAGVSKSSLWNAENSASNKPETIMKYFEAICGLICDETGDNIEISLVDGEVHIQRNK